MEVCGYACKDAVYPVKMPQFFKETLESTSCQRHTHSPHRFPEERLRTIHKLHLVNYLGYIFVGMHSNPQHVLSHWLENEIHSTCSPLTPKGSLRKPSSRPRFSSKIPRLLGSKLVVMAYFVTPLFRA